jgi:predicted dehydrogenase
MKKYNRRNFLKKTSLSTVALSSTTFVSSYESDVKPKESSGGVYMGGYAAPKIEKLRIAVIGVGGQGRAHAKQFAHIENTEIIAISDLHEDLVNQSVSDCIEKGNGRHQNIARYYGDENRWKSMLQEVKPDVVIIATNWNNHAPMAIESMKQGAHAFVEVPLAVTLNELWEIVDTSEQTQKHCMMMENVNYGREELLYLNICRNGIIGDLLHGEAAYIHDLRDLFKNEKRGEGVWRPDHHLKRNGNLYPTHGLGPIAQYMNLSRSEDQFKSIVSYSSPALGAKLYVQKNNPKDQKWNNSDFIAGDINTSIIKTNLGRTIMVQWDEISPRPYSRLNLIQGTKGTLAGYPTRVALEGGVLGATKDSHSWAEGEKLESLFKKYEHPLYLRLGALAKKMGGHGGMDFMMRYRIVECLRKGLPLDQNVYEGAFWSAVAPLSEASVSQQGMPQQFPDFTRGNWKNTEPLAIIS